ncbi:MAG TPA: hypothetical protein VK166_08280 [Chitinophagaceae bacterium]|nr:hypothetical protein [Chitinophagaceae bacterium]
METAVEPKKRPDFLTVLCVLTFIGSTWGIFSGLTNYNNADVMAEMSRQMIEEQKDKAMDKAVTADQKSFMNKMFSGANELMDTVKVKQNSLFSIMSNLLTLIGAVLMFRLKRAGFGIYVLGIAVFIAAPLVIFGLSNIFGWLMTFVLGVIGILFIILYRLNIKYMN